MAYRHLFFDLDGTLTDSAEGIINSFAYALDHFGKSYQKEKLSYVVGPPLQGCFADFGIEKQDFLPALRKFQEYYTQTGIWQNRVFDGIQEALSALRMGGASLYVVTSKPLPQAERVLAHFGLAPYFTAVTGGDINENSVHKDGLLAALLHKLKLNAPRADMVMIGDRSYDIQAAKANGMDACGVLWGIGSEKELTGADLLLHAPDELLSLIQ